MASAKAAGTFKTVANHGENHPTWRCPANIGDPPEMTEFADHLNRLDDRSKRDILTKILDRVIWNHVDREITLDIKNDAISQLDKAIQ